MLGMASRGHRLLLAATAQGEASASSGVRDDELGAQHVQLVPPVAGISRVSAWEQLAREQPSVDSQALLNAATGAVFALDDRNVMSMPWRHVYAVRHGEHFVFFDEHGLLVDEPSAGLVGGRQSVEEFLEEFSADGMFYYRPGKVRQPPALHRCHEVARTAATVAFAEEGGLLGVWSVHLCMCACVHGLRSHGLDRACCHSFALVCLLRSHHGNVDRRGSYFAMDTNRCRRSHAGASRCRRSHAGASRC